MRPGFWDSILSEEIIAAQAVVLEDLAVGPEGPLWTESIPSENGRMALKGFSNQYIDWLPGVSCKARVHEYGGGAISCFGSNVYFVSDKDRSVGVISLPSGRVDTLFSEKNIRFCEILEHKSKKGIFLIGEDVTDEKNIKNGIYYFDIKKKQLTCISSDHDFYSSIQISASGDQIAFVTWDFPYMSWQKSTIYVFKIESDLKLSSRRKICFEEPSSCVQPLWGEDNKLYFISDISGFWNFYHWQDGKIFNVFSTEADCSYPQWKMGRYSYDLITIKDEEALIFVVTDKGQDHLALYIPSSKEYKKLSCPLTNITHVRANGKNSVYLFGGASKHLRCLAQYDLLKDEFSIIRSASDVKLDDTWISLPEQLEFPSAFKGKSAFAFYYPPKNPAFSLQNDKPPLIVRAHGGPTGHNPPVLSLDIQFWTTRGFGFLDVNYSGSSGYGREYRERLDGHLGDADVKECVFAAQAVLDRGLANPKAIFIKGNSSAGVTALMALTLGSFFKGAICYYPVVDLVMLAKHTHKFEKHYLDTLLGPYPESKSVYIERSPKHHTDKIKASVFIMQGKDDKIVEPSGAEDIYLKLKEKGRDVKLILFDGEGHGFRGSKTICTALQNELLFYQRLMK